MAQCYGYSSISNTVFNLTSFFAVPCPSGAGCCAPGDFCLSNNICHFTHPQGAGSYSGYYAGSCTDPTFADPACPKACTAEPIPDVVYNYTSSQWACCGRTDGFTGNVSCDHPTLITFDAPPPNELTTIKASSTASGPTSSPSSSSTGRASSFSDPTLTVQSTTTVTATGNSQASQGASLTAGALAGIVIGAVVGVGLILALLMLWLHRNPNRKRLFGHGKASTQQGKVSELPTNSKPPIYEIQDTSRTRRQELSSNSTNSGYV